MACEGRSKLYGRRSELTLRRRRLGSDGGGDSGDGSGDGSGGDAGGSGGSSGGGGRDGGSDSGKKKITLSSRYHVENKENRD